MVPSRSDTVQTVLADGTLLARNRAQGENVMLLTTRQGEPFLSFPASANWSDTWPSEIGGFWGSAQPETGVPEPITANSGEFAPTGEMIWACHHRARHVIGGDRGTVLLVNYGRVEVVNRRGDLIWKVDSGLDDPRWACMIDTDTVLIACKKDIQIHHRTKGLLKRVSGFRSLGWVRYHPSRAWMIWDGGTQAVVLYDPKTGKRTGVRIGWTDNDPSYRSRWISKGRWYPE